MNFGHPGIFKNRNFLKICVFEDFPHTRLGHFGAHFAQKNFKTLPENGQGVVKNKTNFEMFQNIF